MRLLGRFGAVGCLATTSAAAKRGVPTWESNVFRTVNSLPDALAPVVWAPMQAGALGAPLAMGAFAFIRGDRQRGARIAVTGLMAWGAAKALKREVGRGRPSEFVEDTQIRLGSADRGLGFPSGHAAVAMTLIASIPRDSHPIVRIGGGALALGVGLSRIYVGAHLPLDVVGGWALGLSIASAYDEVFRTNG